MMTQDKPTPKPIVISLRDASRRYNVPYTTLLQWVLKKRLTELWEGDTRVALVSELEPIIATRFRDKPQASDILGEYVRVDDDPAAGN